MKRMNLRKNLNAAALIGGTIVAASALADTQQGGSGYGMGSGSGMMGGNGSGWMGGFGSGSMGGYGGIWLPILLVAVIAGLVVWIIAKKKK
ncbi:MAG: hypothetical protein WBP86_06860 [Thiobacillaceae bacterium]